MLSKSPGFASLLVLIQKKQKNNFLLNQVKQIYPADFDKIFIGPIGKYIYLNEKSFFMYVTKLTLRDLTVTLGIYQH